MAEIAKKVGTVKKTDKASVVAKKPINRNGGDAIGYIGISDRFAILNKLITRDINNYRTSPNFYLYTKNDIQKYLSNPYRYEKQLRQAINYVYGASPHFRRIIQYFVGLSDLAYIVEPYKIDPRKANINRTGGNYRKVVNMLSSMNIKTPLILSLQSSYIC